MLELHWMSFILLLLISVLTRFRLSTWWDDLRHHEGAKIKCGEQHFTALAADIHKPAHYIKAKDVDGFMAYID